jgi:RNA polymerase sigma factor (sigma-70 family)
VLPADFKNSAHDLQNFSGTSAVDTEIMKPLNPETRRKLEQADWERIVLELTSYAVFLVATRRWKTADGMLPKGYGPEDFSCEAIRLVLTGDRQWDPEREPDLLRYLKSIVKSLVYHLMRSKDHRARANTNTEERFEAVALLVDAIPAGTPDPEREFFGDDDEEQSRELADLVIASAQGDDELELIVLELLEGKKPREIAASLGMPVQRVYQCLQNLQRRARTALGRKRSS